jgi:hypothetical protein
MRDVMDNLERDNALPLCHELSAATKSRATFWKRGPWCLLLLGLLASCNPLGFKGFDHEPMYYAFVEGRVTTQSGQPVPGAGVLAFMARLIDGTCTTGEISHANGWTDAQGNYRLEVKEFDVRAVYCVRIGVHPPAGSNLLLVSGVEAPNVTLSEDKRTATRVTVNVTLQNR